MKKVSKKLLILVTFICIALLVGCGVIGNKEFEYIKDGRVMKISIQSTRDNSYKFTVTDKQAIKEIYTILSQAKVVEEKTTLEPDYVFEIHVSPTDIRKFNYIAGLDKNDGANFYSDTENFIVSKRLDNDIIKNFSNIRKPIDFDKVYYDTIVKTLETYNQGDIKSKKIGVNILSDNEVLKFQLSSYLEIFKSKLNNFSNVAFIDKSSEKDNFDIVLNVKTQGYTSTRYKAIMTFTNKENTKPMEYYIINKYEQGNWGINVYTEKPEGF